MMGRRSIRKEVKSAQFARISWWKKKGRDGGQQGCVEGRRRLQVFVASMSNEFANRNPPRRVFFKSKRESGGARPRFSVCCREAQSTGGERRHREGATRERSLTAILSVLDQLPTIELPNSVCTAPRNNDCIVTLTAAGSLTG